MNDRQAIRIGICRVGQSSYSQSSYVFEAVSTSINREFMHTLARRKRSVAIVYVRKNTVWNLDSLTPNLFMRFYYFCALIRTKIMGQTLAFSEPFSEYVFNAKPLQAEGL